MPKPNLLSTNTKRPRLESSATILADVGAGALSLEELGLRARALGPAEYELGLGAAQANFFHLILAVSAVVADRR